MQFTGSGSMLFALVAALAAGCGNGPLDEPAPPASEVNETIALPTHGSDEGPLEALQARVEGDRGTGCVYLVSEGVPRIAALWPPGYQAAFDPLRILDADGKVVAREGVALEIGGGTVEVMQDRIPEHCRGSDTYEGTYWISSIDMAGDPKEEAG